ncbi:MAG: hypothetical protein WCF65_09100 [Parachlamydiaceae bacterium]
MLEQTAKDVLQDMIINVLKKFMIGKVAGNEPHVKQALMYAAGFGGLPGDPYSIGLDKVDEAQRLIFEGFDLPWFVRKFLEKDIMKSADFKSEITLYLQTPPESFDVRFTTDDGTTTSYREQITIAKAKEEKLQRTTASVINANITNDSECEAVLNMFRGLSKVSLAPVFDSIEKIRSGEQGLVDSVLVYGKNLLIQQFGTYPLIAALESVELSSLMDLLQSDEMLRAFNPTEGMDVDAKNRNRKDRASFQEAVNSVKEMVSSAEEFEKGLRVEDPARQLILAVRALYDYSIMKISDEIPKVLDYYSASLLSDYGFPSKGLEYALGVKYAAPFSETDEAKCTELLVRKGILHLKQVRGIEDSEA